MVDRGRIRRGRQVTYNPTVAEEAANGAGPWLAMITGVNADGTVDLMVDVPNVSAQTLVTAADAATQGGAYVQADVQSIATLANDLKTQFNALAADANLSRKTGVAEGTTGGTFSLLQTGPQAL